MSPPPSALRLLARAAFTTFLAAILLAQFWVTYIRIPGFFLCVIPSGLMFEYRDSLQTRIQFFPVQKDIPFDLLAPPTIYHAYGAPSLFLPWWLLLPLASLTLLLIHRRTRRGFYKLAPS